MKTKYILAVLVTAIVTLSFTFISTNKTKTTQEEVVAVDNGAPVGGLAADDSF